MRIAFFIGVLGTDNDGVYSALRKNAGVLQSRGILVPDAKLYRQKFREFVENRPPQSQIQAEAKELMATLMKAKPDAERLVLAMPNFMGTPHQTFNGVVLPDGAQRLAYLASLYPEADIDVFMAVMNPAVFVPNTMLLGKARSYTFFLKGVEPSDLPWTEAVTRLRKPVPNIKFTLWANEESVMLWGNILRRILNVEDEMLLAGEFDLLMPLLNTEGQNRLQSDPRAQTAMNEIERVSFVTEYLQSFADLSQIDVEIPLDNWDQSFVDRVTSNYEDDLKRLKALEGIDFIRP